MLKKFALMLPALRNLHEERNRYAADLQNLSEECSKLRRKIVQLEANSGKNLLDDLDRRIAEVNARVEGLTFSTKRDYFSLMDRGIFVIGHARSGTSILTHALNTSSAICCIGEAHFHVNADKENFASWFNSMHRSDGTPPSRTTYAMHPSCTGWDYLYELSKTFRYVGEKVAFRQEDRGFDVSSFFRFSVNNFLSSNYICVIRDPYRVTGSTVAMFENGDDSPSTIKSIETSQLQTYYLITSLILTLPKVFLLIHEHVNTKTFKTLGDAMGIDLSNASKDYDDTFTAMRQTISRKLKDTSAIPTVVSFYKRLCSSLDETTLRPNISNEIRTILFDLHAELRQRDALPPM